MYEIIDKSDVENAIINQKLNGFNTNIINHNNAASAIYTKYFNR